MTPPGLVVWCAHVHAMRWEDKKGLYCMACQVKNDGGGGLL